MLLPGTFAVVQLLMGNTVEHVLTRHESLQNCSISATANINNTEVMFQGEETTCEAVKVDIVITLAFLSGSIMVWWCVEYCFKLISLPFA